VGGALPLIALYVLMVCTRTSLLSRFTWNGSKILFQMEKHVCVCPTDPSGGSLRSLPFWQ